jgi:hypothetical protein
MRLPIVIFFSALLLTLACGVEACWLAQQYPKFAEPLFNALVALFGFGAGGIIGAMGGLFSFREDRDAKTRRYTRRATKAPTSGTSHPKSGREDLRDAKGAAKRNSTVEDMAKMTDAA